MAVARVRSGWALGVAVTVAAKAGSDGADGGSGHGSDEGWKGQGTAAEAVGGNRTGTQAVGGSRTGCGSRRRQRKIAQGFAGGGEECEMAFWTPPPPPPPRFI